MTNVSITFGPMAKPITEQLTLQGITSFAKPTFDKIQKDADAITRLVVRGVLTSSAASAARKRLIKKIVKELALPRRRSRERGG